MDSVESASVEVYRSKDGFDLTRPMGRGRPKKNPSSRLLGRSNQSATRTEPQLTPKLPVSITFPSFSRCQVRLDVHRGTLAPRSGVELRAQTKHIGTMLPSAKSPLPTSHPPSPPLFSQSIQSLDPFFHEIT